MSDNTYTPLDEYNVAAENIRHEDRIFFANFTVFVTLTGAAIALTAGTKPIPDRALRLAIDVGGILFSLAFWMASAIYLYRWHYFFRRAKELESELGFKLYSGMREGKWPAALRPGSLAWHVLHAATLVFWLVRACTDFSLNPYLRYYF